MVVLRPAARADIEGIWDYTLERWGLDQAIRYDDALRAAVEGLGTGEPRSQAAGDIRPGLRRARVGSHVVIFRETEETVEVVRVLHQRMDAGRWV